jgi:hypothetical protein
MCPAKPATDRYIDRDKFKQHSQIFKVHFYISYRFRQYIPRLLFFLVFWLKLYMQFYFS